MAELEYSHEDGIATILLNRPERKNSFTLSMIDSWAAALTEARNDNDVRVVIVRGAGGAFCSGVDLERVSLEMGDDPLSMKEMLRQHVQRIPLVIEDLDKPLIAAIDGPAVGAGMDMALMCDMRLASHSARFCESYIRVGFVPGAGGCYFLPRLVGMAKAFELFMTGDFVDAQEAHRIGLVNHVYEDDKLIEESYAMAAKIAKAPPVVTGMLKRSLYQSANSDLRTSLELVSSHMGVVRSTPESQATFASLRKSVTGGG